METRVGDPLMRVREPGGTTPRNHLYPSKGTPAHRDHLLRLQGEEEVVTEAEEGVTPPEVGEVIPLLPKAVTEMTQCSYT